MERINDDMLFPEGRARAFTMSYDDGTIHDRRLVEIMNANGVKGTFNLNSGALGQTAESDGPNGRFDRSKIDPDEVARLYAGHEVASHGLFHSSPRAAGSAEFMFEVIEDKRRLEELLGRVVRGYAYPYGHCTENAREILRLAGCHYARAVETTGEFGLPQDFLDWRATCHHNDVALFRLAKDFLRDGGPYNTKKLFYVWGHSYEFTENGNWDRVERLCEMMGAEKERVWMATNIELYDYITAYRSLEYSADGTMIYNPSAHTVWFRRGASVQAIGPRELWRR